MTTTRSVLAGLAVLAAGAGLGYYFAEPSSETAGVPRSRTVSAPTGRPKAPSEAAADSDDAYAAPRTLREAISRPTDFSQSVATYVLAAVSDEASIRKLIDEADGMARQNDREAVLSILFSRYTEIDARAALAYLDETGIGPRPDLLFMIFNSWSKVDLDGAVEAVYERTDTGEQVIATDAILRAYSEADEELLASVRARLPGGDGRGPQSFNQLFSLLARDPEAAVSRILGITDPRQVEILTEVGGQWALRDPEAAYGYSGRISDPNLREWFTRGVFYRWAQRDPARVVEVLNAGGLSRDDETLIINAAMRGLGTRDPAAAFEHALTVEDSAVRQAALRIVTGIWAPSDAMAAARAIETIEEPVVRRQVAATVVTSLVQESPDLALDWAQSIDEGNGQTWQAALQAIAGTNPQLAVNHAMSAASNVDRDAGVAAIVQSLAQSDPEAASFHLPQIGDEAVRSTAASALAREWVRRDAVAAERWAMSLPRDAVRENTLLAVASSGSHAPLDAARIINAIRDEDARFGVASQQVRRLVASDRRTDAQLLAARVELSAERRRVLEQIVREWRNRSE